MTKKYNVKVQALGQTCNILVPATSEIAAAFAAGQISIADGGWGDKDFTGGGVGKLSSAFFELYEIDVTPKD